MREGGVSVERGEHTGGKLLCFQGWTIDTSLIHDAGFVENIAFAKLILKRPAYLGRDNQPDLSETNPSFHSFALFFVLFFLFVSFPFFLSFFLSFFLFLPQSLLSLSPLCVCSGAHACPWQRRPLIETAIVYQHIPLMKRPPSFCWNICTNLLEAASIRHRPFLGNKYAPSVDRQLYSPACALH